ncbi:hypothetical protein V8G56_05275 [Gaetbulibacter aquiaggeris]|uniref:Inclusion body protein n=1 Tax=Gaetbulibacter aquiaggeris TaxID=1735373 RepID=A0ABW7MMU5_9FLAO
MAQNYNITITASFPNDANPADSSLTLDDNGNTYADPGDQITWKIGTGSGVGRISAITDDAGSTDVFGPPSSNEPAPQGGGSGNWRGTINSGIARGSIENYTITWYTDESPERGPYSFDPKISINPTQTV